MRKVMPTFSVCVVLGLISTAAPAASQSASGGATNLQGLNNYNACMAQTDGAQEKLTRARIARLLPGSRKRCGSEPRHAGGAMI